MLLGGRILKVCPAGRPGNQYLVGCLHSDGKQTNVKVHRAVLLAFRGPCPEGMVGCHNDGNRLNNRLANLRWDTHRSNKQDSIIHGTCAYQKGSLHGQAKLDEEKVILIRQQLARGISQTQLAAIYGVKPETISCVHVRKTWKHV